MKKSLLVGAILGLVLTLAIAVYLRDQNLLTTGDSVVGSGNSDGKSPREPVNAPLVSILSGFMLQFTGSDDLMAHRKTAMKPFISTADWEKTMSTHGLPVNQRTTSECRNAALAQAVTIRPDQVEPILNGQLNVLFVSNDVPRCFSTQSKVFLVVDEVLDAKSAYRIPATATIEKVIETSIPTLKHEVLWAMRMSREDVAYVTFGDTEYVSLNVPVTIMQISVIPGKPVIDGTAIPPFMAGVESLKAANIASYMRALRTTITHKPLLVDARDPRTKASGLYPGAINAPFLSTNQNQLRFFLDMPVSLIAGAQFDVSKMPDELMTPLIIFGNDSTDASAVWVARNLRLKGYRKLFFVEGGLEALKRDAPQLIF
ncbi:MAG: rhodanese-like domain-containing protein [Bdellovibrionales bacterium]|nr:rhodanese-like domain-containing protein [Bdellovibrionales bacterium]